MVYARVYVDSIIGYATIQLSLVDAVIVSSLTWKLVSLLYLVPRLSLSTVS